SSQSEPKPPKLPPRDFEKNRDKARDKSRDANKKHSKNSTTNTNPKVHTLGPKPDYQEENIYSLGQQSRQLDDPYYCGFSARVPNFAKRQPMSPKAQQPSAGQYGYGYHMRKVPSSGFLNSYLKTIPNHSRSASYGSFYGSLDSDRALAVRFSATTNS
ncbi:unnamed protein product, partial [Medioppia subpectinata]